MVKPRTLTLAILACLACSVQATGNIGPVFPYRRAETTGVFYNWGATNGLNFFAPAFGMNAFIVDNVGKVLHKWTEPDHFGLGGGAYLTEEGTLIKIVRFKEDDLDDFYYQDYRSPTGGRIREYDKDGTCIWEFRMFSSAYLVKGDFVIMPNGNILANALENRAISSARQRGFTGQARSKPTGFWTESLFEIPRTGTPNPDFDPAYLDRDWTNTCKTISDDRDIVWRWEVYDHSTRFPKFGTWDINKEFVISSFDYLPERDHIVMICKPCGEIFIIDHSVPLERVIYKRGNFIYRWGNNANFFKPGRKVLNGSSVRWVRDNFGWKYRKEGKLVILNDEDPTGKFKNSTSIVELTPPYFKGRYIRLANDAYAPRDFNYKVVMIQEKIGKWERGVTTGLNGKYPGQGDFSDEGFGDEEPSDEGYSDEGYSDQGFGGQGFGGQGFGGQGFGGQGFGQGFGGQGFGGQGFGGKGFSGQGFGQGFGGQGFGGQGFGGQGFGGQGFGMNGYGGDFSYKATIDEDEEAMDEQMDEMLKQALNEQLEEVEKEMKQVEQVIEEVKEEMEVVKEELKEEEGTGERRLNEQSPESYGAFGNFAGADSQGWTGNFGGLGGGNPFGYNSFGGAGSMGGAGGLGGGNPFGYNSFGGAGSMGGAGGFGGPGGFGGAGTSFDYESSGSVEEPESAEDTEEYDNLTIGGGYGGGIGGIGGGIGGIGGGIGGIGGGIGGIGGGIGGVGGGIGGSAGGALGGIGGIGGGAKGIGGAGRLGGVGNRGIRYFDYPWRFMYSGDYGSIQKLPNGNVFVSLTTDVEALEISKFDRSIWKYVSPYLNTGYFNNILGQDCRIGRKQKIPYCPHRGASCNVPVTVLKYSRSFEGFKVIFKDRDDVYLYDEDEINYKGEENEEVMSGN